MRDLSDPEARVIQTLVEATPTTERLLIDSSKVPRSTFQYIRRRAYARGWVYDRYVPSPSVTGATSVSAGMIWPFAGERAGAISRLQRDPGTVVAWATPNAIFYVRVTFGHPSGVGSAAGKSPIPRRPSLAVTCPADRSAVPVYFDAAGALARMFALSQPMTYPVGLCDMMKVIPWGDQIANLARVRAARDVVVTAEEERGSPLFSHSIPPLPLSLPRSQVQCVIDGVVRWRIFPNLQRLPSYRGQSVHDILFVHGRNNRGATGMQMFEQLVGGCGVHPYLVMMDGAATGEAIFLFLTSHGEPVRTESTVSSRTVQSFLQERIQGMTVFREPVKSITAFVDHRYQGLMNDTKGPGLANATM